MEISVTDAKAQLTELVRQAEAGEEIVLTRHGQRVARIVPEKRKVDLQTRRARLKEIGRVGQAKVLPGPSAARSQDFLYDEFGIPK